MILMDLSQIMIATLMVHLGPHTNAKLDESMLRHMVLNSIRANRTKFKNDYGELVICCDDGNYWREDIFPYYKARRKEGKKKSELDWKLIFESLAKFKEELTETFPYNVIQSPRAEADDIIGTIVHDHGKPLGGDPILILSGDKDYAQLQVYANVKQYDPSRKRWISVNDAHDFLYEQIVRGDDGDDIPNILMPDDTFVTGKRQKPITNKRLEMFSPLFEDETAGFESDIIKQWNRNRSLIDLGKVPETVKNDIRERFNNGNEQPRSKIFNYLIKHRLKNLTQNLQDF